MRVMLMIKGEPEPGAAPGEELLAVMGRYNDRLKEARVLLDLAGHHPSGEGKRVRFSEGNRTVIDGPVAESKAAIAGDWILPSEVDGRICVRHDSKPPSFAATPIRGSAMSLV